MLVRFFTKRYEIVKWYRFNRLLRDGREKLAVTKYSETDFSNGFVQIYLAQKAAARMRLDQYEMAIADFSRAEQLEIDWGQRKKNSDSHYLICFCQIYKKVAELMNEGQEVSISQSELDGITNSEASEFMRIQCLPFPKI